jgi:N-glycosylase/DNA lyase
VVGVAAGTPLGWAIARLVWGEVARSTGVAPDLLVPESVWLVVAGTVLVSVALALVPAVSVMRARPAPLLRTE